MGHEWKYDGIILGIMGHGMIFVIVSDIFHELSIHYRPFLRDDFSDDFMGPWETYSSWEYDKNSPVKNHGNTMLNP